MAESFRAELLSGRCIYVILLPTTTTFYFAPEYAGFVVLGSERAVNHSAYVYHSAFGRV